MATDGWLTEAMHREFWSAVPASVRSNPSSLFKFTSPIFLPASDALRYQKDTWESVRLTLAAKRVTKTMGYGLGGTPQERASAGALLAAAAAGTKVDGPKGPFYVTEALADATLAGWDGANYRLRKVWALTWMSEAKEYDFPREHIKVLWDGPFARATQTIFEGGRSIRTTMLTHRLSEGEHAAIGYMRLGARWPDPQGAASRTVSATLSGIGFLDVRPVVVQWRGRISAEGNGSTRTSTGQLHASVRVVEGAEQKGAWQFIAISETSLPDAISLRERLEQASIVGAQSVVSGGSQEQFFIDCEFQPYPRAIADPDARTWHDSLSLRTLTFIVQLDPERVIDSPAVFLQHTAYLDIRPEEFVINWDINGEPRVRRPKVTVHINRFSGKATETFSMLQAPDNPPYKLPWEWHWIRDAQCELIQRKTSVRASP